MIPIPFASHSPDVAALDLVAHFIAGMVLGLLYFRSLWWGARLFASGGRAARAAAFVLGRFVLLGGLLALVSMEGALPLLAAALGVVLARPLVVRRIPGAAA